MFSAIRNRVASRTPQSSTSTSSTDKRLAAARKVLELLDLDTVAEAVRAGRPSPETYMNHQPFKDDETLTNDVRKLSHQDILMELARLVVSGEIDDTSKDELRQLVEGYDAAIDGKRLFLNGRNESAPYRTYPDGNDSPAYAAGYIDAFRLAESKAQGDIKAPEQLSKEEARFYLAAKYAKNAVRLLDKSSHLEVVEGAELAVA